MAAFQLDPNRACSNASDRATCDGWVADFNRIVRDQCGDSQFERLAICRGSAPSSYAELPASTQSRLRAYPRGTTVFGDNAEMITDSLLGAQSGAAPATTTTTTTPTTTTTTTVVPPETGTGTGAMTLEQARAACADQTGAERASCIQGLMGIEVSRTPGDDEEPVRRRGSEDDEPPEGEGLTPMQRCQGTEGHPSERLREEDENPNDDVPPAFAETEGQCVVRLEEEANPTVSHISVRVTSNTVATEQEITGNDSLVGITGTGGTHFDYGTGGSLEVIYWANEYAGIGFGGQISGWDSDDSGEASHGNLMVGGGFLGIHGRYPLFSWLNIEGMFSLNFLGAWTQGGNVTAGGELSGQQLDGSFMLRAALMGGFDINLFDWMAIYVAAGGEFSLYNTVSYPGFLPEQQFEWYVGSPAAARIDGGLTINLPW